jgi:hypothetical protein
MEVYMIQFDIIKKADPEVASAMELSFSVSGIIWSLSLPKTSYPKP